MAKYFFIWIIVWVVIGGLLVSFDSSEALPGVGVAALISLVFMLKTLSDQWSGEVVEVKKEEVYTPDDDGGGSTDTVEYAYIRLNTGKIKKLNNQGWRVGNRLQKNRGEATIKIV